MVRRVLVAFEPPDRVLVARFGAPGLRKRQEEPLVAGEAIDDRRVLAAQAA